MKYTLITLAATTLLSSATSITINVANSFVGFSNLIVDENGTGLTSTDLVEFGYFELSNAPQLSTDSFAGFIAIPSVNLGVNAGAFDTTVMLEDTDLIGTTSQSVQYGIRIFNDSTFGSSTLFNTVTSPDWAFTFSSATPPPTDSEIFIAPAAVGGDPDSAIWEDAANAFATSIEIQIVPEPSSAISLLLGSLLLLGSRRRK